MIFVFFAVRKKKVFVVFCFFLIDHSLSTTFIGNKPAILVTPEVVRIAHVVASPVVALLVWNLLSAHWDWEAEAEIEDDHTEANEDGNAVEVELEVDHGVSGLVLTGPETTGIGSEGGVLQTFSHGECALRNTVGVDPIDRSAAVVRAVTVMIIMTTSMSMTVITTATSMAVIAVTVATASTSETSSTKHMFFACL